MPEYCTNSPSVHGYIGNTLDALVVLEGCRNGILPRVEGRLSDEQRKAIKSGDIYVFNVEESKIKRWTDGRRWSPSRILNNFLVYRELVDDAPSSIDDGLSTAAATPEPAEWQANPADSLTWMEGILSKSFDAGTSDRKPNIEHLNSDIVNKVIRALPGNNSSKGLFKRNGLIKKSITIAGFHVIGYYRASDLGSGLLQTPTSDARLSSLSVSHDLLCSKFFRHPPLVTFGEDGKAQFAGLTDDEPMVRKPPQISRPRRTTSNYNRSDSSSSSNSATSEVGAAVSHPASRFGFSTGSVSTPFELPSRFPEEVYLKQWTSPMQIQPSTARSEPVRQRSCTSLRESNALSSQPRPASSSARFQPYTLAQPRSSPAVMVPLPHYTPHIAAAPPAFTFPDALAWQAPQTQSQHVLQHSSNTSTTTTLNSSFCFDRAFNHALQVPLASDPVMDRFTVSSMPISTPINPAFPTTSPSDLPSGLPFTPHNNSLQDFLSSYAFP